MEQTNSYTYFAIQSNGENDERLIAKAEGMFNPDDMTCLLEIQPFSSWASDDQRKDGSEYLFSQWSAEKSDIYRLDVMAQCKDTIKNLKNKIPQLKQIKEQYDVKFVLMIVPSIFNGEQPWIEFDEELIEFCYLTGTTIGVDMYVYPLDNTEWENEEIFVRHDEN